MTERNPELLARAFHIQYANPNPPVKRTIDTRTRYILGVEMFLY